MKPLLILILSLSFAAFGKEISKSHLDSSLQGTQKLDNTGVGVKLDSSIVDTIKPDSEAVYLKRLGFNSDTVNNGILGLLKSSPYIGIPIWSWILIGLLVAALMAYLLLRYSKKNDNETKK